MFRSAARYTSALRTSVPFKMTPRQLPLVRPFSTEYDPSKVINCAIIAHVDHGEFTLHIIMITFLFRNK